MVGSPIATLESRHIEVDKVERLWTYEEIDDLFPPNDGSLVSALMKRVRELEKQLGGVVKPHGV